MISVLEDPRHHPLGPIPRCESIKLNKTWDVLSRSVLKYSKFIEFGHQRIRINHDEVHMLLHLLLQIQCTDIHRQFCLKTLMRWSVTSIEPLSIPKELGIFKTLFCSVKSLTQYRNAYRTNQYHKTAGLFQDFAGWLDITWRPFDVLTWFGLKG